MRILHTESSKGWGGQEMRILQEARGMRDLGHTVIFAVNCGGKLIARARSAGFTVYEISYSRKNPLKTVLQLRKVMKAQAVDLVNTHSSLDAWLGGLTARMMHCKIIRTRHLSSPIRKGVNSYLLYNKLADFVVTTSSCILSVIAKQAKLESHRLQCIPTGIDPEIICADPMEIKKFRRALGLRPQDILIGTACVVRSWKGINDLLGAAALLRARKDLHWVVVGGGHIEDFSSKLQELGLGGKVIFTGHLDTPYSAIAAMDIFLLLSTAHEGVSQASLQAAYLSRPLVTTEVGGLPEVCIHGMTGLIVPPFAPAEVAKAVVTLADDPALRLRLGTQARALVEEKFTIQHTLQAMGNIYKLLDNKQL